MTLNEITEMDMPTLNGIVKAKVKQLEKRTKAEEAARNLQKGLKKMK